MRLRALGLMTRDRHERNCTREAEDCYRHRHGPSSPENSAHSLQSERVGQLRRLICTLCRNILLRPPGRPACKESVLNRSNLVLRRTRTHPDMNSSTLLTCLGGQVRRVELAEIAPCLAAPAPLRRTCASTISNRLARKGGRRSGGVVSCCCSSRNSENRAALRTVQRRALPEARAHQRQAGPCTARDIDYIPAPTLRSRHRLDDRARSSLSTGGLCVPPWARASAQQHRAARRPQDGDRSARGSARPHTARVRSSVTGMRRTSRYGAPACVT